MGEEKSAHAPYSAGDCTACHLAANAPDGRAEPAGFNPRVIRPVNDHCVSCHGELFRAAPRGHPPRQSFCTSCHDPHASRQRALLLEEDTARACLDYPPPYREESVAAPAPVAPKAAVAKAPAKVKATRKKRSK
jgi:predicted CXXCH cytochrome family protein